MYMYTCMYINVELCPFDLRNFNNDMTKGTLTLNTIMAGPKHSCDLLYLLRQGTLLWHCLSALLYRSGMPDIYSASRALRLLTLSVNILIRNINIMYTMFHGYEL